MRVIFIIFMLFVSCSPSFSESLIFEGGVFQKVFSHHGVDGKYFSLSVEGDGNIFPYGIGGAINDRNFGITDFIGGGVGLRGSGDLYLQLNTGLIFFGNHNPEMTGTNHQFHLAAYLVYEDDLFLTRLGFVHMSNGNGFNMWFSEPPNHGYDTIVGSVGIKF